MREYAVIGLYYPKSPINIGSALRAADCFEASLLLVQGRGYKVSCTDTTKAFKRIPMISVLDLSLAIPYDCVPVAKIPTRSCLNLGACVNVVLYDRLMKRSSG
jgi:tRNA(Leu) C34 or U34 (ribose-2'-O)-methylase TrmL